MCVHACMCAHIDGWLPRGRKNKKRLLFNQGIQYIQYLIYLQVLLSSTEQLYFCNMGQPTGF